MKREKGKGEKTVEIVLHIWYLWHGLGAHGNTVRMAVPLEFLYHSLWCGLGAHGITARMAVPLEFSIIACGMGLEPMETRPGWSCHLNSVS